MMDNYVCVDYLCCSQTKINVPNKVQVFEIRTYNSVSGIGITEISMNII